MIAYRLHTRTAAGVESVFVFASAFLRGLASIPLARQPVDIRFSEVEAVPDVSDVERAIEDAERGAPDVDDVDDRDEDRGSTCGAGCGYCGGCS